MTVEFVQQGAAVDYRPVADVGAGEVVVQGDLVGVTRRNIPADARGSLAVEGVFDFPKATGASTAIAVGANVYWDVADTEAKVNDESGANKLIGKVVLAAGDDDEFVRVRLNQ